MASAQDMPIGYWESLLPYNKARGVATSGNTLFTICNEAFFTFRPGNGELPVPYSKIEGMSGTGMQCVGYDMATSSVILVYTDGNIDIFKDNTFYNIPDLKIKTIAGAKEVYQVFTENGKAYLSTTLGVIVIDLTSYHVQDTYKFLYQANNNVETIPVKAFTSLNDTFYAATAVGLFRARKDNPQLQNFQAWQKIDSADSFTNAATYKNTLFVASRKKMYKLGSGGLELVKNAPAGSYIRNLNPGVTGLFVSENQPSVYTGFIKKFDETGSMIDSTFCFNFPIQVVEQLDKLVWAATEFSGLCKVENGQLYAYASPGPADPLAHEIYVSGKNLWIAHGGIGDLYGARNKRTGVSNFYNNKWKYYKEYDYSPVDTMRDFVGVYKDETDGTVYMASYLDGLFILKTDGTFQILKQNSIFDSSISYYGQGQRQLVGVTGDKYRNIWITSMRAQHQLYAKDPEDNWYKFKVAGVTDGGPLVTDSRGQVWFASYSGGVAVYNTNNTLADPTDDASYHLTTGKGFGNLPSNTVLSIACDKNDNIWVGTANGIGIVNNCSAPFSQASPCDAEIPIVQYDKYAGYLFEGNNVKAIAVDGANRKWVGTDDGIWLLSANAERIIYRFTKDNSPLPSNNIQKIAIDPETGDVYVGTDQGLVSYRSTATEGGETNSNVVSFPNPVPSGYTGTIAIKGLAANADVRITDVNGQLVYRTKALGGQAVWDGRDYTGRRPQSGVYLIFVASSDGEQTHNGKIVFMK